MSNVFTTTSPLGYTVSCTQVRWDNHILRGHENMRGREDTVSNTVANPQWVFQSDEFPSRDVYFSKSGHTNEKLMFVKVIVETDTCCDAEVVSAWMQPKVSGNIGVIKHVNPKL